MADSSALEKLQRVSVLVAQLEAIEAELDEISTGGVDAWVGSSVKPRLTREAQAALATSERRFRAVFDAALDGMLILKSDGEIVEGNPAACAILGMKVDELLGSNGHFFQYDAEVAERLRRDMEVQGHGRYKLSLARTDGALLHLEVTGIANFMADRSLILFRDVTEQHRAEMAVIRSDTLRRNMLDTLPASVALVEPDGTVVAVNAVWRKYGLAGGMTDPAFGVGQNYCAVCDAAAAQGEEDAERVGKGLRALLAGEVTVCQH